MGEEQTSDPRGAEHTRTHELLVFGFGEARFGVEARKVDSVIAWRQPVPLPRGGSEVQGVVQDRGRIVSVLKHPAGRLEAHGEMRPLRILICVTQQGHVGLPATSTRSVGPVELYDEPVTGAVVDGSAGVLTYIDPDGVVDTMLQGAAEAGLDAGGSG